MSCGFLTTPIFAVEQMKRDGTIGKDPEDAPLYPLARSTYGSYTREAGTGENFTRPPAAEPSHSSNITAVFLVLRAYFC